jgi:PAS domain S-box-containing protein
LESDPERKLELFRILVEEAREYAIFALSASGHITSWNAGARRLKGYTAEEAIGQHFSMFYSAEARAAGAPEAALRHAAAEGRWEAEGWRVRKDGSRFWAQALLTAVRNEKGELAGYTKLTRDLTEKRAQEEALQKSERRLSVVLRSMGDALIATDGKGRVEMMNPTAQRLTGWPLAEARGRSLDEVFDIVNEESRRRVESPVARVLREGVVVGLANHTLLISKSGVERPIADSAAPIRDDGDQVSGVVLIFHDQSEAREAERRLAKSEERLRLLVESVEEYAIFMLSPDGFVESWNSGAQRIKQYRADEIIGQHFSLFYPPEDVAAGRPAEALAEAAEHGKLETEGWRVRKDGSRFWGSVVISAVRDPDGKLRGFAKITRDLTDRKLEQRLREQTERLDAVLEGVDEGILLQAPSGQIIYANAPAARMCGVAGVPTLLALPPGALQERFELFDEHNRPFPYEKLPGRLALAQAARFEQLLRVRDRRTGNSWWSLVRATPVLGADGKPAAVVNIWRDVTRERRREVMLRFL